MGLNPVLTMTGPSGRTDGVPGATGGPGRRGAQGDGGPGARTRPAALALCPPRLSLALPGWRLQLTPSVFPETGSGVYRLN